MNLSASPAVRTKSMTFGVALAVMKSGRRVRRQGWNGKGMFVVHRRGYPEGIPVDEETAKAFGVAVGTVCVFQPYLVLRAADGTFVSGWLASQTDMLSEDWEEMADGLPVHGCR